MIWLWSSVNAMEGTGIMLPAGEGGSGVGALALSENDGNGSMAWHGPC
jgi:hypothetical protein